MIVEEKQDEKDKRGGLWAIFGLPALLAICCGLPVLLSAVGLTAFGAFLTGKEIWMFGGVLMIVGLGILAKKLTGNKSCRSDCRCSEVSNRMKK